MVKKIGSSQKFYLHGYDVSGDVGSIDECSMPVDMLNTTGIDKAAVEREYGAAHGRMVYTAFFNDATGAHHDAIKTLPTTDVIASWATGQSIGDAVAVISGKQSETPSSRGADGSFTFSPVLVGNGQALEWMLSGTAGTDVSASASSEATIDSGASSSNGLASVLQIVDIDSGTPTMTIEDSPNDSVWATLKAFAAVADGAEPTAERVEVSGTVDRYLRITGSGTYTNLDFHWAYRRGAASERDTLG